MRWIVSFFLYQLSFAIDLSSLDIASIRFNEGKNEFVFQNTRGTSVKTVPSSQLQRDDTFIIRNNSIKTIPNSLLKVLQSNTTILDLSNNQLSDIDNLFQDLEALAFLLLEGNQITSLSKANFQKNRLLRNITLDYNLIDEISINQFANLPLLSSVTISNNNIKAIDSSAFQNDSALRYLDVSNNMLSTVTAEMLENIPRITILRLDNNSIASIPSTFPNLPLLQQLHLEYNQLTELKSKQFTQLRQLEILYLDHNKIQTVYLNAFYGLSSLAILDLGSNLIAELPRNCLAPLVSLKEISLSENKLNQIKSFGYTPSLKYMNLSINQIQSLPDDFSQNARSLISISLASNALTEITRSFFGSNYNLSFIDISLNSIASVHYAAFVRTARSIKLLNINSNKIAAIPSEVMADIHVNPTAVIQVENNPGISTKFGLLKQSNCITGSILQQFSNFSTEACILCQPGSFLNSRDQTCTPCTTISERSYTSTYGSNQCSYCSPSMLLSIQRDSCVSLTRNWIFYISLGLCVLFPSLVLSGRILVFLFWVYDHIQYEKNESFKKLRQVIRQQIVQETSSLPIHSLNPIEQDAIMRVMSDDLQLQTVYIEWEKIILIRPLAMGAYGEVSLGEYCGGRVAIKRLLANRINAQNVIDFAHEIHITMSLRHPSIVQFIGVTWNAFHDLCAISEYMPNGDLFQLLKNSTYSHAVARKSSNEEVNTAKAELTWHSHKLRIVYDTSLGLSYMHGFDPPIIHRDLKSKNILIGPNYKCKLSDFGLSRQRDNESTMTNVGTYSWLAPEMIKGDRFDESIDVYSLGIVMIEMITHKLPYYDAMHNGNKLQGIALSHHVAYCGLKPSLPKNWREIIDVNFDLYGLIEKCIDHTPCNRPKAKELVNELKRYIFNEADSDRVNEKRRTTFKKFKNL